MGCTSSSLKAELPAQHSPPVSVETSSDCNSIASSSTSSSNSSRQSGDNQIDIKINYDANNAIQLDSCMQEGTNREEEVNSSSLSAGDVALNIITSPASIATPTPNSNDHSKENPNPKPNPQQQHKFNEVDPNCPMNLRLIRVSYHGNDITDAVSSFIKGDQSLELLGGVKGKNVDEVLLDFCTADSSNNSNSTGPGLSATNNKIRKLSIPTVRLEYMYQSDPFRARAQWGETKHLAPITGTKITLISAFLGPKGHTSRIMSMIDKKTGALELSNVDADCNSNKSTITINYCIETASIELELLDSDDIIIPKFSDFISTFSMLSILSSNAVCTDDNINRNSANSSNVGGKIDIRSLNINTDNNDNTNNNTNNNDNQSSSNSNNTSPDDNIPGMMPQNKSKPLRTINKDANCYAPSSVSNSSSASINLSSTTTSNSRTVSTTTTAITSSSSTDTSNGSTKGCSTNVNGNSSSTANAPSTPPLSPSTNNKLESSSPVRQTTTSSIPATMKGYVNKHFRGKHHSSLFRNVYCVLEVRSGLSIMSYYKSPSDYKSNKSLEVDYLRLCEMTFEEGNVVTISIVRADEDSEEEKDSNEEGEEEEENREVNIVHPSEAGSKVDNKYTVKLELNDVPTIPEYRQKWLEALSQHVAYSNRKSSVTPK